MEIWEDQGDVPFSSNVKSWMSSTRIQEIESAARCDSIAERSSVEWHDFDIAMTFPETFHDDSHYWFKIDEYSTIDSDFVNGKAFFCQACESHYRDATSFTDHAYPSNCLGCAYKSALSQCAWSVVVVDYRVLKHTEADRTVRLGDSHLYLR